LGIEENQFTIFAPTLVTLGDAIPYSWQLSGIDPATQIVQNQRRIVMTRLLFRYQAVGLLALSVFCAHRVVGQEQSGKVTGCSMATLQGSFGYTSTGDLTKSYVPAPYAGPFAEVGRQTFDGKGNTEAKATVSSNGSITPVTVKGAYTVNSDCTGTMTLDVSPFDSTVNVDFVIDANGAEIRAIVTDTGVIESRVYKKQA
jgi:hypothetical protein